MDARTWADSISIMLFERDERRLTRQLEDIIDENARAGGHAHGFLYGGEFHSTLPIAQRAQAEKKLLEPAMHTAGKEYMEDVRKTGLEQLRVKQGIFVLLQGCRSKQDIRDALPEELVNIVPTLRDIPRTRQPGWVFADKPLSAFSFKETSDLISFYVCNQILY